MSHGSDKLSGFLVSQIRQAVYEDQPSDQLARLIAINTLEVGKMRNCWMRKVKCGMDGVENCCGMVCELQNAKSRVCRLIALMQKDHLLLPRVPIIVMVWCHFFHFDPIRFDRCTDQYRSCGTPSLVICPVVRPVRPLLSSQEVAVARYLPLL